MDAVAARGAPGLKRDTGMAGNHMNAAQFPLYVSQLKYPLASFRRRRARPGASKATWRPSLSTDGNRSCDGSKRSTCLTTRCWIVLSRSFCLARPRSSSAYFLARLVATIAALVPGLVRSQPRGRPRSTRARTGGWTYSTNTASDSVGVQQQTARRSRHRAILTALRAHTHF